MYEYYTLKHFLWPENYYLFLVIGEMKTFCESLKYHKPYIFSPHGEVCSLWNFAHVFSAWDALMPDGCSGHCLVRCMLLQRGRLSVITVSKADHTQLFLSCDHLCYLMTVPQEM